MVCDAKSCSMKGQWTLPEAVLTIVSGSGNAPETGVAAKQAAPAFGASTNGDQGSDIVTRDAPTGKTSAEKKATDSAAVPSSPTTAGSPAAGAAVQSEIAQKAQQGLIPFLIASAIGGLFALVMPCVWPMVPITVNFFVKQGQGKGGRQKATGLAIIYCLSIIGIFTAVGVLFSFFFSASSLQTLANNPWLNLFVAGLFVAFGLSLLGIIRAAAAELPAQRLVSGRKQGGPDRRRLHGAHLDDHVVHVHVSRRGGLAGHGGRRRLLLSDRRAGDIRRGDRAAILPARPVPGLDFQDAAERRLDERGQGRRRPGRNWSGLQVRQHGRTGLGHPRERLVRRAGRA